MNRWISNIVLGFFTLVLVTAYGVAKQPSVITTPQTLRLQTSPTNPPADSTEGQVTGDVPGTGTKVVFPGGEEISVVVAATEASRRQGLSGAPGLPAGSGMLFVFDRDGNQPMWMKDMRFAIDMLWLDDQGKVVHIEENVPAPEAGQEQLPTYASLTPAKYVLEVTAGTVSDQDIQIGEKLTIS